jgi:hypothetical protein
MKKYLAPLTVFVGGQFLLLIAFLFFPAISASGTKLAADTAPYASTFWGWSWVVSSTRLIVWVALEFAVIFASVMTFLHAKDD